MVKIGNATYKFNYTFLKNFAKDLFDVDLDRGEPPDGTYTLVADDGRFLAAYDGVSWVTPYEDDYDHLNLTLVWTKTFRDAVALGNLIVKSDKFKYLGMGMRFVVSRVHHDGLVISLEPTRPFKFKPEEPKPEEPKPEEPKPEEPPTAVGEQWQDNAVPGPDIPENRKDDEEVPQ